MGNTLQERLDSLYKQRAAQQSGGDISTGPKRAYTLQERLDSLNKQRITQLQSDPDFWKPSDPGVMPDIDSWIDGVQSSNKFKNDQNKQRRVDFYNSLRDDPMSSTGPTPVEESPVESSVKPTGAYPIQTPASSFDVRRILNPNHTPAQHMVRTDGAVTSEEYEADKDGGVILPSGTILRQADWEKGSNADLGAFFRRVVEPEIDGIEKAANERAKKSLEKNDGFWYQGAQNIKDSKTAGVSGLLKNTSDTRREGGAARIVQDAMSGIDPDKANAYIANHLMDDPEFKAAADRLKDATSTAEGPQVSEDKLQKIVASMTPAQRKEYDLRVEQQQRRITENQESFRKAYATAWEREANKFHQGIADRLVERMATENMPKNELEAFAQTAYNASIPGLLTNWAVGGAAGDSALHTQIMQRAMEKYGPSLATRMGGEAAGLLMSTPMFSAGGALGKAGAAGIRKLAERSVIKQLISRGLEKGAEGVAKRVVSGSAKWQLAQAAMTSGVTLGAYDAVATPLAMSSAGETPSASDVLGAVGRGFLTGALLPGIGKITGKAVDAATSRMGKYAAELGGFASENAAFVGVGALADGIRTGEWGTPEQLAENFGHSVGVLGIMKSVGALKRAREKNQGFYDKVLAETEFTPDEVRELDRFGIDGKSYKRAIYDLLSSRNTSAGREISERAAQEVSDGYTDIMRSDVSMSLKTKLMYLTEGRIPARMPLTTDVQRTMDENGHITVSLLDPAGNLVQQRTFSSGKAAEAFELESAGVREINTIQYYENAINEQQSRGALEQVAQNIATERGLSSEAIITEIVKSTEGKPHDAELVREVVNRARPIRDGYEDIPATLSEGLVLKYNLGDGGLERALTLRNESRSPEQRAAVVEYAAKVKEVASQKIKSEPTPREQAEQQLTNTSEQQITQTKNQDDNVIYTATMKDKSEVNIIKGANLVYNPETGEIDTNQSDKTVAVRYAAGNGGVVELKDGRIGVVDGINEDGTYNVVVQNEQGQIVTEQIPAGNIAGPVADEQGVEDVGQPANTTSNPLLGRSLNSEEAQCIVEQMQAAAVPAPQTELTPENWTAEFGEDGMVSTPIGNVKMGENQYLKMAREGRNTKFGMIRPTLSDPYVIVEEPSMAKDGREVERSSSYVFVKPFVGRDGVRKYLFTSITVQKDGKEVVVSNQEKDVNRISKLLQNGEVVWIKSNGSLHPTTQIEASVPQNDSRELTSTDSRSTGLGINSSAVSENKDTTTIPESQAAGFEDSFRGRSLTADETEQVVSQMQIGATPAPQLELTPENWTAAFGEDGIVSTPIGDVKMGENQYLKLQKNSREQYFGMIKPTLESPDVVLEETDPRDGAERNSKYLFIKTFAKSDGSRYVHFESVTVMKDNLEVSVSSHEIDRGPFMKKMQNDRVLHLEESLFGSEGRLTEPRSEGPDLVPTPSASVNKDTTTIPESQVPSPEIPRLKNGAPDYNSMSSDMLAMELSGAIGHDKAVERLQVARGVNAKNMEKLRKALDGMGDLNKAMSVEQQLTVMQQEDARLVGALEQLGAAEGMVEKAASAMNFSQEIDLLFPEGLPDVRSRVLADIARGQRFVWSDSPDGVKRGVATELGFSGNESERRARFGILGTEGTGAMHVSRYVHDLWQDSNGYAFDMDDAALRDEVIDVLLTTPSRAAAMKQLRDMAARSAEDRTLPRDAEDQTAMKAYEAGQDVLRESPKNAIFAEKTPISQRDRREAESQRLVNGERYGTEAGIRKNDDGIRTADRGGVFVRNGDESGRNNDVRRQTDGRGLSVNPADVDVAASDRSDIRVFEEGLAAEYYDHSEHSQRDRREAESQRLVKIGSDETRLNKDYDNGIQARPDSGRQMASDPAGAIPGVGDRGDIRVFEEGLGTHGSTHSDDSQRDRREAESQRLVAVAKEAGQYIDPKTWKSLGEKVAKRTGESVVYIDRANNKVYKIKDPYAKSAIKGGLPEEAIYDHVIHNLLFPETQYKFEGISDHLGDVRIVLSQDYIKSYGQPTQQQIDSELAGRGLFPEDKYTYGNNFVSVTDVEGDNALLGHDGRIYFIDPIIRLKKPAHEVIDTLEADASVLPVPFSVVRDATSAPDGISPERWRVIVEQLRRVVGAENVVTDPVAVRAAYDEIMQRGADIRRQQVTEANERYNTQLERFAAGELSSDEKIDLGVPGATLQACGIEDADMTITQRVLREHMRKHALSAADIKDLPAALENPIMVYEWGDKAKSSVVITEIARGDERIAVAVKLKQGRNGVAINAVASVHGKSVERLLADINTPLTDFGAENLKWVDKEKVLDWITAGDSFGPSGSSQGLVTATKIVTNFKNPKIGPENNTETNTAYFRTPEGEVSGFTADAKIYLDGARMNANTPMHEYTELWSQVVAQVQPKLWTRGVELMKQTGVWKQVNKDPNYKHLSENMRASETLSRITAKRFEDKQAEITDDHKLMGKLRKWIRDFWNTLKGTFSKWTKQDLDKLTADDFAKMPMRDFVEGIDLTKYNQSKNTDPRFARDMVERKITTLERLENKRAGVIADKDNISNFEERLSKVETEIEAYKQSDHVADTFGEPESNAHLRAVEDVVYDIVRTEGVEGVQVDVVQSPEALLEYARKENWDEEHIRKIGQGILSPGYYGDGKITILASLIENQKEATGVFWHERNHGVTDETCTSDRLTQAAEQAGTELLNEALKGRGYSTEYYSMERMADEYISRAVEILAKKGLLNEYLDTPEPDFEKIVLYLAKRNVPEKLRDVIADNCNYIKNQKYGIGEENLLLRTDDNRRTLDRITSPGVSNNRTAVGTDEEVDAGGSAALRRGFSSTKGLSAADGEPGGVRSFDGLGVHSSRGGDLDEVPAPKLTKQQELIADLRRAVRESKASTRAVAQLVSRSVRSYLSDADIDAVHRNDVNHLVSAIGQATTMRGVDVRLQLIDRILSEVAIRDRKARFDKLLNLKVQGEDGRGRSIAATVDDTTRVSFEILRANIGRPYASVKAEVEDAQENNAASPLASWGGLELLKLHEEVLNTEADVRSILADRNQLQTETAELYRKIYGIEEPIEGRDALTKQRKNKLAERRALTEEELLSKKHLAAQWEELVEKTAQCIGEGRNILREQRETKKAYKSELIHQALDDVYAGKTVVFSPKDPNTPRKGNVFIDPYKSMFFMVPYVSVNAYGGRGYLYDRLITGADGWMKCRSREIVFAEENNSMINDFCRQYDINNITSLRHQLNNLLIDDQDNAIIFSYTPESKSKEKQDIALTIGNGMCITLWSRQADLKPTLYNMGFDDDLLGRIEQTLPSYALKFAKFSTDYLEQIRRERYNPAYLMRFGTQLADIPGYFPARRRKTEIRKEENVDEYTSNEMISPNAGSLIKRRRNKVPLDITQNPVDILMDHLREMDNFAAFAPYAENVKILLNSKTFKDQLNKQHRGNFEHFKNAARVSLGTYTPKSSELERALIELQGMAAASKIAFGFFTALKQPLSIPAFAVYSWNPVYQKIFYKNVLGFSKTEKGIERNFKWCYNNMPIFRERWNSRYAGDERLAYAGKSDTAKFLYEKAPKVHKTLAVVGKGGMWANARIDIAACGIGARSVYEYEYSLSLKDGLSKPEAHEFAIIRAQIAFNESQQSSETLFLSPAQLDKTLLHVSMSIFENSNKGYGRKEKLARETLSSFYVKERRERMFRNAKERYIKRGLNDREAEKRAKADRNRAARHAVTDVLMYKYFLNILWRVAPKIVSGIVTAALTGDDDELEKAVKSAFSGKELLAASFRNAVGGSILNSTLDGFWNSGGILEGDLAKLMKPVVDVTSGKKELSEVVDNDLFMATLSFVSSNTVGVDIKKFVNIYNAFVVLKYDGSWYPGIAAAKFVNAPKDIINAAVLPPREGEGRDNYLRRIAYMQERAGANISGIKLKKWARNYTAYQQAKLLGISAVRDNYGVVTVPELKTLNEEYEAAAKDAGMSVAGNASKGLDWSSLTPDQQELWRTLARRAWAINDLRKEVNKSIIFNDAYKYQLEKLMQLKREYIKMWTENKK